MNVENPSETRSLTTYNDPSKPLMNQEGILLCQVRMPKPSLSEKINSLRTPLVRLYLLGSEIKDLISNFNLMIPISDDNNICLLYTSPSPRDLSTSRMPSSA